MKRLFLPVVLFAASRLIAGTGADLFGDNCASCHGADGRAQTPMGRKLGAKDLRSSKMTEAQVIERITQGFNDASGKAKMPPFKEQLSADEIRRIAEYVLGLRAK